MVRRFAAIAVALSAVGHVAVAACSSDTFSSTEDPQDAATDGSAARADAAQGVDANSDASDGGADASGCPSGRGPAMVEVNDGAHFCIDSTEVTEAQYAVFANTLTATLRDDLAAQLGPFCKQHLESTAAFPAAPAPAGNEPMVQIGWCEAQAFCAWSGKRLCGEMDGGVAPDDNAITDHAWLFACTRGGTRQLSYGAPTAGLCNTLHADGGVGEREAVAARTGCQGGYDGIYDLMGNVGEWENSFQAPQDGGIEPPYVRYRGADFMSGSYTATCVQSGNGVDSIGRDNGLSWIGFRCCASP